MSLTPGTFPYHPAEMDLPQRLHNLTPHQHTMLQNFETSLQPLDIVHLKMPSESNASCLLRILRGEKFDLAAAQKRANELILWREEHQIHQNLTTPVTEMVFGDQLTLDDILPLYPYGAKGTDRQGRPIVYKQMGQLDYNILSKDTRFATPQRTNIENLVLWEATAAARLMHYILPQCTVDSQYHVENYVGIIDLNGLGINNPNWWTNFTKELKDLLLSGIKVCSEQFPDTLGVMFIINAPLSFNVAWGIISKFLDSVTVAKIKNVGVGKLKEFIDPDMLPIEYGGTGLEGLVLPMFSCLDPPPFLSLFSSTHLQPILQILSYSYHCNPHPVYIPSMI